MPALLRGWFHSVGRTATVAFLLIAVVCVALVLIEGWRIVDARHAQDSEARTAATNLAKSVAEKTEGTFEQAAIVLSGLVERLETDGPTQGNLERIERLLRSEKRTIPHLQRLTVLDAGGHVIATDASDLDRRPTRADRDYFTYHRSHDDRAPHLGPPVQARSNDEWVVTVSRRFNDRQGQFAGVAIASVSLGFFSTYFDQFDIGSRGTITLVSRDGRIVNRRPYKEEIIGSDVSQSPLIRDHLAYDDEGAVWLTSRLDGVDRLTAFHKAGSFPVYAVVALAKDEILAPWIEDSLVHGGATLAFLLVIGTVGVWLVRQSVTRHRDQHLLRQSRAALVDANARLAGLASEDALTGIANRREFDRALAEEHARAVRRGASLALLMIDVDQFKDYNDRYGHVEGDACLRKVAELVRAGAKRPGDLAARYGGEEFVVLLPATDAAGAKSVADQLLIAIHRAALPHARGAGRFVTASIGVAAIQPGERGITARSLVERADRALYAAKDAGRDRVSVAGGIDAMTRASTAVVRPPASALEQARCASIA